MLKNFIWFEQSKLRHQAELQGKKFQIDVADVISLRKEVRVLYHIISQGILLNDINETQMVQILYELSQKRVIRDYFIKHEKM